MKRHFAHIILLLIVGMTLLSCARDMDTKVDHTDKDKVEVSLLLNLSQRQLLKSRAIGDDYINPDQIYLLVFNVASDGTTPTTLREVVNATSESVTSSNEIVNFIATLTTSADKSAIYVVANFAVTTTVGSTFAEVQKALKTGDLTTNNGEITAMPLSHPMISNLQLFESITNPFTMGTTDNPVKLYRNTVKIDASIANIAVGTKFELESISLYNAPVAGYVFPNITEAVDRYNYADVLKQTLDAVTKKTGEIICYEASLQTGASKKSPFVIIKGKYDGHEGYYRVEFVQSSSEVALLRNCIYTFDIKNVQRVGYATIDEAILNTAGNAIIYDIFIEDIFSTDIVSNGEQYLGVSNSELVVHSDYKVAAENILAVVVSYSMKSTWTTPGKITCSKGITLISGAEIPVPKGGSDILFQDMDIYISLTNEFIDEGIITISVGDLHKVITVRRSILPSTTPMTYDGGYIELTHQDLTDGRPILIGEIVNPQVTTWIRLSKMGLDGRASARSKIVLAHGTDGKPTEDLFIHVWGNEEAMYTSSTVPKGYFYISYANDHGRTRYCVLKEVTELSFDANGGYGQPGNIYEWIKLSDNTNAYILLPQAEPKRDLYTFEGWTEKSDGTGTVFKANTLFTTTFATKDILYAKWKLTPVLQPYILVGAKYWSVGNLVADGKGGAKAGTSTEAGLMFKFGSLIGFDRTNLNAMLKPADCTLTPDITNTTGVGYTNTGSIPANNFTLGTGDPCLYYLGSGWRLPAKADYTALGLTGSGPMQAEGKNEKGEPSTLKMPTAKSYINTFSTNWEFAGYSMYQTVDGGIGTTPYGFNDSGIAPGSGSDGWQQKESLGAVRCVRDTNPNTTP